MDENPLTATVHPVTTQSNKNSTFLRHFRVTTSLETNVVFSAVFSPSRRSSTRPACGMRILCETGYRQQTESLRCTGNMSDVHAPR